MHWLGTILKFIFYYMACTLIKLYVKVTFHTDKRQNIDCTSTLYCLTNSIWKNAWGTSYVRGIQQCPALMTPFFQAPLLLHSHFLHTFSAFQQISYFQVSSHSSDFGKISASKTLVLAKFVPETLVFIEKNLFWRQYFWKPVQHIHI